MTMPRDEIRGAAEREIKIPIGRRFATGAVASTYDAQARTVDLTVATETMVRMPGYMLGLLDDYYYEILDCSPAAVDLSQVAADNCPILDAHSPYSVDCQLGKFRNTRCAAAQVVGTCHFGQSDDAVSVEADVAAGTPPKVSAGYRRIQAMFERFEGEIPVYRITQWTLQEVSFVPIAADPNAGVRSDALTTFPCTVNEGTRTMPQEPNAPAPAAPVAPAITPAPVEPPAAPAPAAESGVRAAPDNRPGISRFTASTGMAFVENARAFGDAVVTRARQLVEQNDRGEISIETAASTLLQASAEAQRAATGGVGTGGGNRIEVTADERAKFLQGAENSILVRAGVADMVRKAAELRGEKIDLDPGEFRGVRNAELARLCLERSGVRISSYDRDVIVGLAFTQVAQRDGGMNTTGDFPLLLENSLHKTLQAAYATTPDTWRRFCGIGTLMDFRPHPRYLRGTFGTLDDLTENGEFKNKNIPDAAKEIILGKTKGNIVGLSRQAIVNDDLGAFNFITVELGRAAKLTIEVDVYTTLARNSGAGPTMNDGNPLFHTSHKNIGTAGAPSVAAFDEMRQLMASQKDVSGNEVLDIRPSIWLGPLSLGGAARVVNGSLYDPDAVNKLQRPNIVNGMFSDIVDTARMTGTRHYAFADKDTAPALEVAFLNGVQEPYLEQQLGWRTDGTEYKVRHDYGVGGLNWRSAVTNAGA
jgi:hypothetical protein